MVNKPYRPSNGTEGRMFEAYFCQRCIHDHQAHLGNYAGGCPILARALVFRVYDPEYPKEWVYDPDSEDVELQRGLCTAFVLEEVCDGE